MKSKLFGSDWDMAKASGDMPDAFSSYCGKYKIYEMHIMT